MDITNNYVWQTGDKGRENHFLLPKSIQGLLVGHTACGKSTVMNNLLLQPKVLDYDHLMIFGNSLHQLEYRIMKAAFDKRLSKSQLQVLFREQKRVNINGGPLKVINDYDGECKGKISVTFYENCEDIPDPSSLEGNVKNCIVFDDCLMGPQQQISSYYSRGRHNGCSLVFYLSQSYFKIPRQVVRNNANFIILFRQGRKDLHHIFIDHVSMDDISYDSFVNDFCTPSWDSNKHAFITIDLTRTKYTGKYRRNLNQFWLPPTV